MNKNQRADNNILDLLEDKTKLLALQSELVEELKEFHISMHGKCECQTHQLITRAEASL